MESDKNKITKFTAPLTVASTSITPIVVVNSKVVREANNILSGSCSNNKSTASGLQIIKDKFDNLKCSSGTIISSNLNNSNIKNNKNNIATKKHDTMLLNSNKNLSVSVSVSAVPIMKQQNASNNNGLNLNKNNNNKKDIMPSPAVPALVTSTGKPIGKNKGITFTKIQKDLQDPEDRKKRCADRYDSSESSDR